MVATNTGHLLEEGEYSQMIVVLGKVSYLDGLVRIVVAVCHKAFHGHWSIIPMVLKTNIDLSFPPETLVVVYLMDYLIPCLELHFCLVEAVKVVDFLVRDYGELNRIGVTVEVDSYSLGQNLLDVSFEVVYDRVLVREHLLYVVVGALELLPPVLVVSPNTLVLVSLVVDLGIPGKVFVLLVVDV